MITIDGIETAYCFFHQKWQVYKRSAIEQQREDIEYAIADYVERMDRDLYRNLADGKSDFLLSHAAFEEDMRSALSKLTAMQTIK